MEIQTVEADEVSMTAPSIPDGKMDELVQRFENAQAEIDALNAIYKQDKKPYETEKKKVKDDARALGINIGSFNHTIAERKSMRALNAEQRDLAADYKGQLSLPIEPQETQH